VLAEEEARVRAVMIESSLRTEPEEELDPVAASPRGGRDVRQVVGELSIAAWALSALAFALETGLVDEIRTPATPDTLAGRRGIPPRLAEAILDVLQAIGLVHREGQAFVADPGLVSCLDGPAREQLQAEIRSNQLQGLRLVESGRRGLAPTGWCHDDSEILQAQGVRSRAVVEAFVSQIFPHLTGVVENLQGPNAAFLDVGSGVAAISVEMCHRFPTLRAVGLDPLEAAIAQADRNIERAGLEDRIELRRGKVEDLDDDAVFDVAQVPIFFLPADVLAEGLARVHKALRPGGWVVLQVLGAAGLDLRPSVLRLWCVVWGSEAVSPEQAAGMLRRAAFEEVVTFPPIPGPPVRYVVGRRRTQPGVARVT
jgi:SAM-dependent methyltransferase